MVSKESDMIANIKYQKGHGTRGALDVSPGREGHSRGGWNPGLRGGSRGEGGGEVGREGQGREGMGAMVTSHLRAP